MTLGSSGRGHRSGRDGIQPGEWSALKLDVSRRSLVHDGHVAGGYENSLRQAVEPGGGRDLLGRVGETGTGVRGHKVGRKHLLRGGDTIGMPQRDRIPDGRNRNE